MLDDNGTLLWSTGLGHPDKIYLTDIDPDRPGMEVFLCLELGTRTDVAFVLWMPEQDNRYGISVIRHSM